jgi:uncharacterized damage-inducible protein DinB
MKQLITVLLLATFALAAAAQTPATPPANPLITEAKASYNRVKGNILKAAEKMPEENYSFSPTKEERPFGQVVAHVADANTGSCSAVKGEAKQGDAASKKTKAELLAALKASFDLCDAAFDSVASDAAAAESITMGRGKRTKLSILWGNTGHDMEQYASISGYLRQKGIVPPSSEAPAR